MHNKETLKLIRNFIFVLVFWAQGTDKIIRLNE